jgi:RNA polymerase sigma factor (sigma-70 family)
VDYDYIEKLARSAKDNDAQAKEALIGEFTPFINSISRKIFIHGYEYCDLKNECFLTLLNCISKYDLSTHRFVAYATNAIKNNLNVLVIKSINQKDVDGLFSLNDDVESAISLDGHIKEEPIHLEYKLLSAIKNHLNASERHLIIFIYFMKNTLTNYAYYENISYVTASKRKKRVLEKLKKYITGGNELWELMI